MLAYLHGLVELHGHNELLAIVRWWQLHGHCYSRGAFSAYLGRTATALVHHARRPMGPAAQCRRAGRWAWSSMQRAGRAATAWWTGAPLLQWTAPTQNARRVQK